MILLFQIHWPAPMKKGSVGFKPENLVQPNLASTWKAMEALFDSGKARAIGVSNFSSKKLGDLLEVARVPPAVNQVECHPSWRQDKLRDFCNSNGVHLSVSFQVLNDHYIVSAHYIGYFHEIFSVFFFRIFSVLLKLEMNHYYYIFK